MLLVPVVKDEILGWGFRVEGWDKPTSPINPVNTLNL